MTKEDLKRLERFRRKVAPHFNKISEIMDKQMDEALLKEKEDDECRKIKSLD